MVLDDLWPSKAVQDDAGADAASGDADEEVADAASGDADEEVVDMDMEAGGIRRDQDREVR